MQAAADEVAQRLLERLAKLPVEVRVDDGVHRRVEVAHPEEQVHKELGRPPVDDGADDVPDEEGEPAGDEGAHDDAQRFGRLVLALHLADGPLGGRARTRFRVLGVRVSVPARLDLLGFIIYLLSEMSVWFCFGFGFWCAWVVEGGRERKERERKKSISK